MNHPREANIPAPSRNPRSLRFLVSILPHIIGGLIVAGILLFTTTPLRLFALIAFVIVAVAYVYIRHLESQLKITRGALANTRETAERDFASKDLSLSQLGVSGISPSLGSSEWSPDAVMARAQHRVRFLGVFGHKWVLDATRKSSFREMLTRVQLNGGNVEFLLLDPNCSAAALLASYRNQDVNTYRDFYSLDFFRTLSREFDCFQLKVYCHFPILRLVFVDDRCAISRFRISDAPEKTLAAPQLAFRPDAGSDTWSLYQPLVKLFDLLWAQARNPFNEGVQTASASPVAPATSLPEEATPQSKQVAT